MQTQIWVVWAIDGPSFRQILQVPPFSCHAQTLRSSCEVSDGRD